MQSDRITGYLETVREQIRWKRAQPIILEEIQNHIIDQKNALIHNGLDEDTATDKALAEMGDPVVIGEQLDQAHKPRPDWGLLALTAALLLLGLTVQYIIGPDRNGTPLFEKQLVWAVIGIAVMCLAYFADFTIIGKYPRLLFLALCAISAGCLLFAVRVNGIYSDMIYPLMLLPAAYAGFVYSLRSRGYAGFILCGVVFTIPVFLCLLVPSLTVLLLLCVSCLAILTGAVLKGWFNVRKPVAMLILYIPTGAVLFMPFFMMMGDGYLSKRLQAAVNPSLDPEGCGYIGITIQKLLSHSHLIGEGIPIHDWVHEVTRLLPNTHTDFLLTYLIHEFGWIVLIGILMLFAAFLIRAVNLCQKQQSVLGFLTSLAIVSTLAVQCVVYIVSNLGFVFFPPLSLPLISYGGKALITNMFLIGILLSVFRTGGLVKDRAESMLVGMDRFIQYDNGRIIVDLNTRTKTPVENQ